MEAREVVDRESESPQRSWRLAREAPGELGDPLAMCRPGLEALFRFADGLLDPLGVRADLAWLDRADGSPAGYPPRMEWRLVRRDLPAGMAVRWPVPDTLVTVDAVDLATVVRFLADASNQTGRDGVFACPARIALTPARARLFDPVAPELRELILGRREGPAAVPVERIAGAAWLSGPRDGFITAPVEASLRVDPYRLDLDIDVHWSPWSEPDRPGTDAVERAVARLVDAGWELDE